MVSLWFSGFGKSIVSIGLKIRLSRRIYSICQRWDGPQGRTSIFFNRTGTTSALYGTMEASLTRISHRRARWRFQAPASTAFVHPCTSSRRALDLQKCAPAISAYTPSMAKTGDFLNEWNNSVYCRVHKIFCRFKEQARSCHTCEKCGLKSSTR